MKKPRVRKKIVWKLPTVMSEREVYTQSQLQELLKDYGISISTPQLSRIHKKLPEFLKVEILEGLLTVLDCTIDDLIQVKEEPYDDGDGGEKIEKPVPEKTTSIRKISTPEKAPAASSEQKAESKKAETKKAADKKPGTVLELFEGKIHSLKGLKLHPLPSVPIKE